MIGRTHSSLKSSGDTEPNPTGTADQQIAKHTDSEGDPFCGPVAMRLGVGGSWSTVGRTRGAARVRESRTSSLMVSGLSTLLKVM
ncbi:hypothetical protein FZI95_03635 [Mycobacterium sp. CBMA247]|nr:hypothetical protein [Mycolicibacterium sp. CBMA 329]MUL86630.1 hypothetical protein [Mycolicibacterium sp. CBMA 331]MUM02834.1 hypothetical protein [Mycolicibacterium sp. CBMA 334]MUM27674.1 hypothetical protein [Mycolicibacterium sp. CBMA 295]MUM36927.1 hypothetical protein [Mycolicibacterium sp. CBMA 247]MUM42695.1 hypothetical protein [Mycolicibacterium sp. CBMA 294]